MWQYIQLNKNRNAICTKCTLLTCQVKITIISQFLMVIFTTASSYVLKNAFSISQNKIRTIR